MMNSFAFSAFARSRSGAASAELQKLFESSGTSIEEIMKFPNIVSELQSSIDTRGFFSPLKIEQIIRLVFEPDALDKYNFDDARKISFVASEMLSTKIPAINEFFFNNSQESKTKKSSIIDEMDTEFDFDNNHKDLLLSPVNSVKSKSTTTVESYNKNSLDMLMARALDDADLDETRAGYLSKMLVAFFHKYKSELLNYIFKSGFDYRQLASFPESLSMTDLLCNFALFENTLSNDSIIFHESQSQIGNDHIKQRIDLLRTFLFNETIIRSGEAASNSRYVVEEFFTKFKNISESETIFMELFGNEHLLNTWLDFFLRTKNDSVRFELINSFKLFVKFIHGVTGGKNEILPDNIKTLLGEQGSIGVSVSKIIQVITQYFILEKGKDEQKSAFINTYKGISIIGSTRIKIAYLEAVVILLRQKTLPVYKELANKEFFSFLLVR